MCDSLVGAREVGCRAKTPEDEYDVLSVFCTVTHGAVSVYSVL